MHNEFPSHQGKAQFSIKSYLQDRVYQARKLNDSFLYHNSRMIALLSNGMFVYYSKCFQAPQNSAYKINATPKSGVYFSNVLHSCVKITEYDVELIVKFKKSQQYHFDNEMISFVKEPRSQEIVVWIFVIKMADIITNNNGKCKLNESVNSFFSFKNMNFDERSQNTTQKHAKTEKSSIEQKVIKKNFKNKKQVKWMDTHSSNLILELKKEKNFQQFCDSQNFVSDELLEINEENIDFNIKSLQARKLSLSASYHGFQAKIKEN